MEVETTIRRWGESSLAVVIPKETIQKNNLKEGDKIKILIEKESNLTDIFNTLKTKRTAQDFKNLCKINSE